MSTWAAGSPAAACRRWCCRPPSSRQPRGSLYSSPQSPACTRSSSHPAVLAAISILGALGTGAAYVLNYRLITDEGPTVTSTVTYLLPVVAVVLGIVFLGEPVAAHLLAGTGIVLVGIALVQRRTPAPASTPEASTREREP